MGIVGYDRPSAEDEKQEEGVGEWVKRTTTGTKGKKGSLS